MSTFEKAAKRLEELRRAGVDVRVPEPVTAAVAPPQGEKSQGTSRIDKGETAPAIAKTQSVKRAPSVAVSNSRIKEATIDLARMALAGFVTPTAVRSRIADEFRVAKRPVLDNVRGNSEVPSGGMNLIMVTSALPGEGKTFTAINLAMSIAMELDSTVLLVDADVARPSMLSTLGLPPSPGLMDLLTNPSVGFSDVLIRTNVERLSLLPAGSPQEHATELLASQAMGNLVQELSRRYADRVILFDSPPLLPTTESRVLATHMGQIVMVVAAHSTTQGAVRQAMVALKDCPVVMTILNKTVRSDVSSYYGYGSYGYAG
ncbi:MAG: XrtA-associated tyrosine autokinase [Burkholderiales bacterium]